MSSTIVTNAARGGGRSALERRSNQPVHGTNTNSRNEIGHKKCHPMMVPGAQQHASGVSRKGVSSFGIAGNAGRRAHVNQAVPSGAAVIATGNQMMLLRQKNASNVPAQNRQHSQLQKQQKMQLRNPEQENVGGISMLEVMQNLRMLEQQQVDARRKLLESQRVKAQENQLQKQLHLLLEGKKFSNGQALGELDKYRDFLSFAARKLGDRKLSSSQLDADINEMHRRLDGGIKSARMMKVTGYMVDSILEAVKKKLQDFGLLKDKCSTILKKEVMKYEAAKEEEQRLRSSIHESQAEAQKWADLNKTSSAEVTKLEIDKSDLQMKEEEAKKELLGIRDEIKQEEERFSKIKEVKTEEAAVLRRQKEALFEEVSSLECTLESAESAYQNNKKEIFDLFVVEGWDSGAQDPGMIEVRMTEAKSAMENEFNTQRNAVLALERELQEMEKELESIENSTREKDGDSKRILTQVDTVKMAEEKRKQEATTVENQLAFERAEIQKLESSLEAMKEVQENEKQQQGNIEAATIAKQSELKGHLQSLQKEAKAFDQKLQADEAHFQKIDVPTLRHQLERIQEQADEAEAAYNSLDWKATPMDLATIDDSGNQISNLLQRYPQLHGVTTKYDPHKAFKAQIETALYDFKLQLRHSKPSQKRKSFLHYDPCDHTIPPDRSDFSIEGFKPEDLTDRKGFELSSEKPASRKNRLKSESRNIHTNNDVPPPEKRVRWEEDDDDIDYSVSSDWIAEPDESSSLQAQQRPEKTYSRKSSSQSSMKSTFVDSKMSNAHEKNSGELSGKLDRWGRKKMQSDTLKDSMILSNEPNSFGGTSVLEIVSQKIVGKEPIKKRKVSEGAFDKTSDDLHPDNDTVTEGILRDAKDGKRLKLSYSDVEKWAREARKSSDRHSTVGREKEKRTSAKDRDNGVLFEKRSESTRGVEERSKKAKSPKNRDLKYHREKTTKPKTLGANSWKETKSKDEQHGGRCMGTSSSQSNKETKPSRDGTGKAKSSHELSKDNEPLNGRKVSKVIEKGNPTRDKKDDSRKRVKISSSSLAKGQTEENKSSRNETRKTKSSNKVSKEKEKELRDKPAREGKPSKGDKGDPTCDKKDESRKRVKMSSSSLAKADERSRASMASKSRRSRKKAGSSTGMLQAGGRMDDDFGFNF
ncbi:hypothetical protein IV203_031937 [Nitzschia inconspicua]|uniref:Uncharacterized protein n=1 Tax=Nitzschia inconspicua TaxID=303405 RepID=A0A9K3Q5K8_9STRA|nr:hypothetical protein IV203_031937 [Nitzschia inconspicua]